MSKHIFRQPSFLKAFDYVFTLGFSAPCSSSQKSVLNNSSLCSRAGIICVEIYEQLLSGGWADFTLFEMITGRVLSEPASACLFSNGGRIQDSLREAISQHVFLKSLLPKQETQHLKKHHLYSLC